ncbi:MAG: hypothetical protein WD060_07510 [Pirellulales bacterium]
MQWPPAFLPARPITEPDLAAVTGRVRRRVTWWFKRQGFLDSQAAADMLAWEHSGFWIDASVRIALDERDVPSFTKSLEHFVKGSQRAGPTPSRKSDPTAPPASRGPSSSRPMTIVTSCRPRPTSFR